MKRLPSQVLAVELLETRTLPDATLLIGTWNVDIADTGGSNRDAAAFQEVFRALGQLDLLTVTEVRSNTVSGSNNDTEWLTQQLNAVFGAGLYAHPTENAASDGGGTEGVIYNGQSLALLQVQFVGTASTSGPARQEYRYHFHPLIAPDGAADFYVYVGHYKAGTTSTDRNRRNVEAQQVRADADALGPSVPILYTGDFNSESSNEAALQTLLGSGNGQAFDPVNRLGSWGHNAGFIDTDTIAADSLHSRYDLLWETGAVRSSNGGYGLKDRPSTYHAFGNNGSVPLDQGVDAPANTALADLPNRLAVLHDLARVCSDHLPVVQQYRIVQPPAPATHFRVTADMSPVVAGAAFGITVTALDANDQIATGYQGTVHFTSADPHGATVPGDYSFQPSDAGTHTFAGGVTLYTAGTSDVTAIDTASNVVGSTTVTVIAAPAVAFRLIAQSTAFSGTPFDITVVAVDPFGNTDTNYQGTVTFSTSDSDPGVVLPTDYTFQPSNSGTVTFPNGVTLITPGDETLTATDTVSGITSNISIAVSGPAAP
jgi:endonuclease/exonuclease/phosphatase family metal-dependent hydrolase